MTKKTRICTSVLRGAARLRGAAIAIAFVAAGTAAQASTIASWTFEVSNPTTAGPHAAEVGTGSATGSHAGAATYSAPAGDGSVHAFSSNTWAVGDYYQFQASSTGQSGISLDWDQTASNTGPGHFQLQYSINGGAYSNSGSVYTVAANLNPPGFWNTTTYINGYHFTVDLSAITALDNAATIAFRLTMADTTAANGVLAAGGANRVDNFTISANPVPEPSSMALAALGLTGIAGLVWRRRRAH